MGYTTEFIGKFTFNREPSKELKDYINRFAKTRHVKRDVEAIQKIFPDWEKRTWKGKLGREAEFFLQPYNEVNYQSDDRLDIIYPYFVEYPAIEKRKSRIDPVTCGRGASVVPFEDDVFFGIVKREFFNRFIAHPLQEA